MRNEDTVKELITLLKETIVLVRQELTSLKNDGDLQRVDIVKIHSTLDNLKSAIVKYEHQIDVKSDNHTKIMVAIITSFVAALSALGAALISYYKTK